jgi:hypothetical protein
MSPAALSAAGRLMAHAVDIAPSRDRNPTFLLASLL